MILLHGSALSTNLRQEGASCSVRGHAWVNGVFDLELVERNLLGEDSSDGEGESRSQYFAAPSSAVGAECEFALRQNATCSNRAL